jgi:hypothetical protein
MFRLLKSELFPAYSTTPLGQSINLYAYCIKCLIVLSLIPFTQIPMLLVNEIEHYLNFMMGIHLFSKLICKEIHGICQEITPYHSI